MTWHWTSTLAAEARATSDRRARATTTWLLVATAALVTLGTLAGGMSRRDADRRVADCLASMGLHDFARHLTEELSGGQQQRVAVARALATEPAMLLADEPTSDLDEGNRVRIVQALRRQADAGTVVLLTTHDPETAAEADTVPLLDEGRARRA